GAAGARGFLHGEGPGSGAARHADPAALPVAVAGAGLREETRQATRAGQECSDFSRARPGWAGARGPPEPRGAGLEPAVATIAVEAGIAWLGGLTLGLAIGRGDVDPGGAGPQRHLGEVLGPHPPPGPPAPPESPVRPGMRR